MTAGEYQKRFTALDYAWKSTNPTKPETYDQSIKNLTAELKKPQKKADTSKTWTICKSYFKELYEKQKRYNKATEKYSDSKSWRM